MGYQEECNALEKSGWLAEGDRVKGFLWGEINGELLEQREGILYFSTLQWGFFGRDFEFLTPFSGYFFEFMELLDIQKQPEIYHPVVIQATKEEKKYAFEFFPSAPMYREKATDIADFIENLRAQANQNHSRISNQRILETVKNQKDEKFENSNFSKMDHLLQDPHSMSLYSTPSPKTVQSIEPLEEEVTRKGIQTPYSLLVHMAQTSFENREWEKSEEYAKKAMELQKNETSFLLLVEIYQQQKNFLQAFLFSQEWVSSFPFSQKAWCLHACLSCVMEDWKALEKSTKALQQKEENLPYWELIQIAKQRHQRHKEEAWMAIQKLRESHTFPCLEELYERWMREHRNEQLGEPLDPSSFWEEEQDGKELSPLWLDYFQSWEVQFFQELSEFVLNWFEEKAPSQVEKNRLYAKQNFQHDFLEWLQIRLDKDQEAFSAFLLRSFGLQKSVAFGFSFWKVLLFYFRGIFQGGLWENVVTKIGGREENESFAWEILHILSLLPKEWNQAIQEFYTECCLLREPKKNETKNTSPLPTYSPLLPETNEEKKKQTRAENQWTAPLLKPFLPTQALQKRWQEQEAFAISQPEKEQSPENNETLQRLFQDYVIAHQEVDLAIDNLREGLFVREMEKQIKQWKEKTGHEADCFVRIENGKPQIKIRNK